MAQHDYVIANQGFPAFRSDLNDALAAIVSNNSGATEPTTMFAHQMWVDTAADPSVLKIRNADNDAWITVGVLDQTGDTFILRPAAGSASVPAYSTTSDTNTGVYFPGADRVGITTGGSQRVEVDASGNVGIGTSSPVARLHVEDTSSAAGTALVRLVGQNTYQLDIESVTNSSGVVGNRYNFAVNSGGGEFSFSNSGGERARIDSSGNLLVGTTSTSIVSGNTGVVIFSSGRTAIQRNVNGTDSVFQAFGNAGAAYIQGDGDLLNTNNSYGSLSDVKLKQDIVDAGSQWDDIKGLRVRKYRWKTNPDGFMQIGLVAQEVEEVSAGLVDESQDYEEVTRTREVEKTRVITEAVLDENGNEIEPAVTETYTEEEEYTERVALNTTTKSVKYSVLYMKAVKALQEAMERIETLEAKVAALENA